MKLNKKLIQRLILFGIFAVLIYHETSIKIFYYEMRYGIEVTETYQQHNALILEVEKADGYSWYIFQRRKYFQITNTPAIVNCSKADLEALLEIMKQAAHNENIASYFPILYSTAPSKGKADIGNDLNLWVVFHSERPLEGEINIKSKKVIGIIGN